MTRISCRLRVEGRDTVTIQYSEPLDRTFHALGSSKRRGMLALLAERGECTAGELGQPLNVAQATASKHIRVLEAAGLVSRTVYGRSHRFRLEAGPFEEAEGWLVRHREFWQASLDSLGQYLQELVGEKSGES